MRIVIFGGTGRTGRHIVEQALAAGHDVVVYARDPSKLSRASPRLRLVAGSFDEPDKLIEALRGAEAAVSALGPTENKPPYRVTAATDAVLAAMHETGVRRLVVTAGAAVEDPGDAPGVAHHLVKLALKTFARHVYADMAGVCRSVRESALDWTIVRAPRLTDGPPTGRLKVGYVGRGVGVSVARADLATFVVGQLEDRTRLRQAPAVSN